MQKHFDMKIEEICEEIVWILSHVINLNSNVTEIILKHKIFESVLEIFSEDTLNKDYLLKILNLFENLLAGSSEFILDKILYLQIIKIVSAFIYFDDEDIKLKCLEITKLLSCFQSNSITENLINSGIIKKILGFKDINNIKLSNIILVIVGNILAEETIYLKVNI